MHSGDSLCHPTLHNPSSFFSCCVQYRERIWVKCTRNQLFIRLWPTDWNLSTLCALGALAELLGIGFAPEITRRWSRCKYTDILHISIYIYNIIYRNFTSLFLKQGSNCLALLSVIHFQSASHKDRWWSYTDTSKPRLKAHPAHVHAKQPCLHDQKENCVFLVTEGLNKRETKCDEVVYWQPENSSKCSTAHLHPNPET